MGPAGHAASTSDSALTESAAALWRTLQTAATEQASVVRVRPTGSQRAAIAALRDQLERHAATSGILDAAGSIADRTADGTADSIDATLKPEPEP